VDGLRWTRAWIIDLGSMMNRPQTYEWVKYQGLNWTFAL